MKSKLIVMALALAAAGASAPAFAASAEPTFHTPEFCAYPIFGPQGPNRFAFWIPCFVGGVGPANFN